MYYNVEKKEAGKDWRVIGRANSKREAERDLLGLKRLGYAHYQYRIVPAAGLSKEEKRQAHYENPASIHAQIRRLPSGQIQLKIPLKGHDPAHVAQAVRRALGKRVQSVAVVGGKGGRVHNPRACNPFEPGLSYHWYLHGKVAAKSGKFSDMYAAWHARRQKPVTPGAKITAQESFYQGFMDVQQKQGN